MRNGRRGVHHSNETSLALFDEAAQAAASQIISRYSTSFGLGARLLPRTMRGHIAAIYAMVRVADEIVDTYRGDDAGTVLAGFEAQVHRAMEERFSTDVIAHAFGVSARAVGIDRSLVDPFFASMRMDLDMVEHDEASFAAYIHGSAEVIGEMCLAVFMNADQGPAPLDPDLRAGARRLGAAYQKVNFLRDLGADVHERGRIYLPGVNLEGFDDATLGAWVAHCRADLTAARATMAGLPPRARMSVQITADIYDDLLDRIAATPARDLAARRIRVPGPVKARLAARRIVGRA